MKAVLYVLLPFELYVPLDVQLPPSKFDKAGYHIVIFPPDWVTLDPELLDPISDVPMAEIARALNPDPRPNIATTISADNAQTQRANLLHIEFHKPDFDRRQGLGNDPPLTLISEVVFQFIT